MTTHEFAAKLLSGPNVQVVVSDRQNNVYIPNLRCSEELTTRSQLNIAIRIEKYYEEHKHWPLKTLVDEWRNELGRVPTIVIEY